MKYIVLAAVVLLTACGSSPTAPPISGYRYSLRIEEPTLGAAGDTTAMRVTVAGPFASLSVSAAGIVSGAPGIYQFSPPAGSVACSGRPRSCWASQWRQDPGSPLRLTGSVNGDAITLAFSVVYLFSPQPPAAHAFRFRDPFLVSYDSSSAGVYELVRGDPLAP